MKITKCKIAGLLEIEHDLFEDERGYFYESFNREKFRKNTGLEVDFVQDNQSLSKKGVLRGLHFQKEPHAQGKLIRVIKGSVLDVAVDIRKKSDTFGKYHGVILDDRNKKSFWIPEGFAHGFLTLEDDTIISYKCTEYYNRENEVCILWNDTSINIDWKTENVILSPKDNRGITLLDYEQIV